MSGDARYRRLPPARDEFGLGLACQALDALHAKHVPRHRGQHDVERPAVHARRGAEASCDAVGSVSGVGGIQVVVRQQEVLGSDSIAGKGARR